MPSSTRRRINGSQRLIVSGGMSSVKPLFKRYDYVLVLGQTLKDATVDTMWFGDYWKALYSVIHALVQIVNCPVVVKLHPYVDGYVGYADGVPIPTSETEISTAIKHKLEGLGAKVYRGLASVHSFLPKARSVVLCNSGAGLEALLHKKPVIAWGYPEYHWACYDLRHLCDLPRALETGTMVRSRRGGAVCLLVFRALCV